MKKLLIRFHSRPKRFVPCELCERQAILYHADLLYEEYGSASYTCGKHIFSYFYYCEDMLRLFFIKLIIDIRIHLTMRKIHIKHDIEG